MAQGRSTKIISLQTWALLVLGVTLFYGINLNIDFKIAEWEGLTVNPKPQTLHP